MKRIKFLLAAFFITCAVAGAVTMLTGCHTPTTQKVAVNTLFTLHKTADLALDDYLDLMNQGKVATNSLPTVLRAYTKFQQAFNAAVVYVGSNTNATPPAAVLSAAASFAATVATAKKGTP